MSVIDAVAEKVFEFKMDFIELTDKVIIIDVSNLIDKSYMIYHKELLIDIFSEFYNGQHILIKNSDGENLTISGFLHFLEYLIKTFNIPRDHIEIESSNTNIFYNTMRFLPKDFNKSLDGAKFVGLTLRRHSQNRLRLAYEIDKAFPFDNFTVFHEIENLHSVYNTIDIKSLYKKELKWLYTKKFDSGLHGLSGDNWKNVSSDYSNIWSKFLIEIVPETDIFGNEWFTEKTAKCLGTGKPFVLISGQGSLKNLRNRGFITFNSVIDESYDDERLPINRIRSAIKSLQELYNSSDRDILLQEMYKLAKQNIEIYNNQSSFYVNQ